MDGADWAETRGPDGLIYRARLFSYLGGRPLREAPDDARLMRGLGRLVAELDRGLRGFFHPDAAHPLAWDLKRASQLADLCSQIQDPERREVVEAVFDRFRARVPPLIPSLRPR